MTPTPAAIVLFGLALLLAMGLMLADPAWWSLAVNGGAFVLALLAIDALLALPKRKLACTLEAPDRLGIGEPGALAVSIAPLRHPGRTRLSLLYGAQGPLEESAETHAYAAAEAACEVELPILPRRRGTIAIDSLWIRWQGPLGLMQKVHRLAGLGIAIPVIPNIESVRLRALEFEQRENLYGAKPQMDTGGGAEFDALREYQPGFDTRFIDWKHSARHGKLLCKEFRIERNHQIVLAIDHGRLMNEPLAGFPRLDHAINAALALGWIALKSGDLVGLFEFDSTVRHYLKPMRGTGSFAHLRRRSAEIAYSPEETNFTLGLAELDQRLDRRALIILFTDFVDTVSAELLVENLQRVVRRHFVLFVTLRDPLLAETLESPSDGFLDAARTVVVNDMANDRAIVFERLSRLGIHCLDTPHDKLSAGLVNRYLAIKQRDLI